MNIDALRARRNPPNTDMPDALCLEAADEIERLKEELEFHMLQKVVIADQGRELEFLRLERAKLRAALEEIADLRYDNTSAATIAREALK